MKKVIFLIIVFIVATISGCGRSGEVDYDQTESGLRYAFHVSTGDEKPEIGDILSMDMVYSLNDSILFSSHQSGIPMFLQLTEPEYPGDIFEGLAMMSLGDSVSFLINAEDFFIHTAGVMELPPFVEECDDIRFDIRLQKILDEEGFAMEQQRLMEEQMQQNVVRAEEEEELMQDYLDEEGITIEPTESGLYFIERERGEGPQVQVGNLVAVHYEGRLLDGTVFDSSYDRGEPLEFNVGMHQVIPGWDEGIGMMRQGGKATLIIPSYLGYGDRGAGQAVPPFSTLVFEVEVVDIIE